MNNAFLSEVLKLSNEFRADYELAPLIANQELDAAAQEHSQAMAQRDFFDHTGLDGREPWDRAEDAGYDYQAIAENIAAGQRTPESVVNGWINSPGHRANLLNPTYTDLGVGYVNLENDTGSVNYNTYWIQLFGSGDSVPITALAQTPSLPPVTPDPEPVSQVPAPAEAPATEAPATEAPTAEVPTAEAPTAEVPPMEMPVAEVPTAEPPATETPDMEAPKMEMPTYEGMAGDADALATTPMETGDMQGIDTDDMNMGDMHMGNMPHSADHAELDNLIARATPTHTAVKNGAWTDPTTWQNSVVPGDNATVLIPEGTTVTYDDAIGTARLKTIAIQGNLKFPPNQDTQLTVETILNSETGRLDIGSPENTVASDKNVRIIFTSDSGVDTQWDPTQLTKGLVSHGEVNIFGAGKLDRIELAGDALAGSNVLTFKEVPAGWQIDDKIVVGGTQYGWNGNDQDNSRFQDEVLTITGITGNEVTFTNDDVVGSDTLRFDHMRSPLASPNETSLYAANLSRNVSFETENGKDVPIANRAHVMLMHNPNVNIHNAGFYDLGRSDKTNLVDEVGENRDGSQGNGTNVRGRYSLHLHQMGVEDPNSTAALLKGNAIWGSPGWGVVQHESNAGLEDNVVFDVAGAGIVAESGNEIGWWTGNTVIKTTGIDSRSAVGQQDARARQFDLGFEGDGYWVQGAAMVNNKDNVAISSNSTGMELFGSILKSETNNRPVTTIPVAQLPEDVRSLFAGQMEVDIRDIPMATVEGFEAYNNTYGLEVWGHKTNFDGEGDFSENRSNFNEQELPETAHSGRSQINDFKLWGNRWIGAKVQYSSNIDLNNGLILGVNDDRIVGGSGLFSNHATFNSVYDNLKVAGFKQGVDIEYPNTDKDFITTTLKNSTLTNNTYSLSAVGDEGPKEGRPDDFGSFLRLENNQFAPADNNRAPVARFRTKAAGGLAMTLDASGSADSDPLLPADGTARDLPSKGIAAYGWDLDNDGTLDKFGRRLDHVFDRAGSREISLTVLDNQGQATTVQQTVDVQPSAYGNAFADGSFNDGTLTQLPWKSSSRYSDQGWYVKEGSNIGGGVAQLSRPGEWSGFVGQVTRNDKIHRGAQTLNFRMKNVEGSPDNVWEKNEVTVTLIGVNGQFDNNAWEQTGPTKIGTLPMQSTELAKQVYGGKEGPDGDFFDWKNISLDVDLGQGYDYLMFQVNSSGSRDAGDLVAIDNVSLKGDANAIAQPLITQSDAADLTAQPDFEAVLDRVAEDMVVEDVVKDDALYGDIDEPAVEPVVDSVDELADAFVEPTTTDVTGNPTTVDSPSAPSLDMPTPQPDPFVEDTLMGEPTSPLTDDFLYPAADLLSVYIDGEFAGQTTSSPLFYSMGISRVDLTLQPDGGDSAVNYLDWTNNNNGIRTFNATAAESQLL